MKKLEHFFAAAALFFAVTILPAAAADASPVLLAMQKKMSSVKTVYTEFTQSRELKLFSEPLKSEGVMLVERPDKIRWETTAPYQTILLGDRNSVAQFEFNDGKWEKLKLGFPQLLQRLMQQMSAMNQGNVGTMLADYSVSVSTNSAATNSEITLTFVPKDATIRGMMSSIDVKLPLDLSTTREVVMHEPNGDLTRITFTRSKYDVVFPANTFDQAKPAAVAEIKAAAK